MSEMPGLTHYQRQPMQQGIVKSLIPRAYKTVLAFSQCTCLFLGQGALSNSLAELGSIITPLIFKYRT